MKSNIPFKRNAKTAIISPIMIVLKAQLCVTRHEAKAAIMASNRNYTESEIFSNIVPAPRPLKRPTHRQGASVFTISSKSTGFVTIFQSKFVKGENCENS